MGEGGEQAEGTRSVEKGGIQSSLQHPQQNTKRPAAKGGATGRFVKLMAEETGLEPASPKAAVFKTAALPIMLLLR
jgi:hypothetical protein